MRSALPEKALLCSTTSSCCDLRSAPKTSGTAIRAYARPRAHSPSFSRARPRRRWASIRAAASARTSGRNRRAEEKTKAAVYGTLSRTSPTTRVLGSVVRTTKGMVRTKARVRLITIRP